MNKLYLYIKRYVCVSVCHTFLCPPGDKHVPDTGGGGQTFLTRLKMKMLKKCWVLSLQFLLQTYSAFCPNWFVRGWGFVYHFKLKSSSSSLSFHRWDDKVVELSLFLWENFCAPGTSSRRSCLSSLCTCLPCCPGPSQWPCTLSELQVHPGLEVFIFWFWTFLFWLNIFWLILGMLLYDNFTSFLLGTWLKWCEGGKHFLINCGNF